MISHKILIALVFVVVFLHSGFLYVKFRNLKKNRIKIRKKTYSVHILYYFVILISGAYIYYYPSTIEISSLQMIICYPMTIISLALVYMSRMQLGIHHSPHVEVMYDHKLVNHGLYKYLDHPMYYFETIAIGGVVFIVNNYLAYIALGLWIASMIIKIKVENKLLKEELSEYKTLLEKLLPTNTRKEAPTV